MNKKDYRFLKNTPLPNIIIICSVIQLLLILVLSFININIFLLSMISNLLYMAFAINAIYLVSNRQKVLVEEYSICFVLNIVVAVWWLFRGIDVLDAFGFVVSLLNVGLVACAYIFFKNIYGNYRKLCLMLTLQIALDIISIIVSVIFLHSKSRLIGTEAFLLEKLFLSLILLFICLSIDNDPYKEYISPINNGNKYIRRRSIGMSILLSIFTVGVYYVYWNYKIVKDIRKLNKQKGGIGEFLLITFVPFYDWYWVCSRGNKLTVIAQNNRIRPTGSGIAYLVLDIFFLKLVTMSLMQDTLNNLSAVMDENFVYGDIVQTNNYAPYMQPVPYAQPVQGMQQPPVQSTMQNTMQNNIEILKQLNELKNQGIITEEEFIQKKEQLMK